MRVVEGGDRWGAGVYVGPRAELRGLRALLHEMGDTKIVEVQFHACAFHRSVDRCQSHCLTHGWHPFFYASDFAIDYWKEPGT